MEFEVWSLRFGCIKVTKYGSKGVGEYGGVGRGRHDDFAARGILDVGLFLWTLDSNTWNLELGIYWEK